MFCFCDTCGEPTERVDDNSLRYLQVLRLPEAKKRREEPLPRQTLGRAMDQGLGNVEPIRRIFFQLYEFLDELALVFLRTFEDFDEAFEHVA